MRLKNALSLQQIGGDSAIQASLITLNLHYFALSITSKSIIVTMTSTKEPHFTPSHLYLLTSKGGSALASSYSGTSADAPRKQEASAACRFCLLLLEKVFQGPSKSSNDLQFPSISLNAGLSRPQSNRFLTDSGLSRLQSSCFLLGSWLSRAQSNRFLLGSWVSRLQSNRSLPGSRLSRPQSNRFPLGSTMRRPQISHFPSGSGLSRLKSDFFTN